jgi:hypothetical protein
MPCYKFSLNFDTLVKLKKYDIITHNENISNEQIIINSRIFKFAQTSRYPIPIYRIYELLSDKMTWEEAFEYREKNKIADVPYIFELTAFIEEMALKYEL